jgi:hypothetical protein
MEGRGGGWVGWRGGGGLLIWREFYRRPPDVSDPKHKFQLAVPSCNDGAIRNEDGTSALLGVADPGKNNPQHHRVQQLTPYALGNDHPGRYPAVCRSPGPESWRRCLVSVCVCSSGR